MSKHTPGPWVIRHGTNVMGRRGGVAEASVAACGGFSNNFDGGAYVGESEANAHLIASAPDMLAALEEIVAEHDAGLGLHNGTAGMEWARDAIRRARGLSNDAIPNDSGSTAEGVEEGADHDAGKDVS